MLCGCLFSSQQPSLGGGRVCKPGAGCCSFSLMSETIAPPSLRRATHLFTHRSSTATAIFAFIGHLRNHSGILLFSRENGGFGILEISILFLRCFRGMQSLLPPPPRFSPPVSVEPLEGWNQNGPMGSQAVPGLTPGCIRCVTWGRSHHKASNAPPPGPLEPKGLLSPILPGVS